MVLELFRQTKDFKWLSPFLITFVFCCISLAVGQTPSASSKPAVPTTVDGESVFRTTVQINSHKPVWWIKSAGLKDPLKNRVCKEDNSKSKAFSKALLSEIHFTYPNLKGTNGLFNVTFVPKNANQSILEKHSTCTYDALLYYRHGRKNFSVPNQFIIKLNEQSQPVAKAPAKKILKPIKKSEPEPKSTPSKKLPEKKETPVVQKSKTVSPKTQPEVKTSKPTAPVTQPKPKVFKAEDKPVPEKVEVSEESRLALATPPKPAVTPVTKQSGSAFKQGLAAYNNQEWAKATEHFSNVPVPKTRRRGVPEREDYVKANFYKGLSLQQQSKLKEAVDTYKSVLSYEKFFPIVNMNLGICYLELRQFAKAHKAFTKVIRDQNRVSPQQYDDVMQRTRYFWALVWTRLYHNTSEPDRQTYYKKQAASKWLEYTSWFGDNPKYKEANQQARIYLNRLK